MRRRTPLLVAVVAALVMVTGALPGLASHDFEDVPDNNIFHGDIDWLAEEDITRGCNPPDNTRFCPQDNVTRGQMAAFFVRALGLTSMDGATDFTDTDGHLFEGDIALLSASDITRGCNPPANDEFCPDDFVTREQMASFVARTIEEAGHRLPAAPPDAAISGTVTHTPTPRPARAERRPAGRRAPLRPRRRPRPA